ncbi:histidine kinase [Sphingobacterium sp. SGR-19]|uniref:tetratricopeptide repeat-containing sensor histidine kinase n=1 Tax=Sphingobacterium sp. SGR-19 TaxID=2710886 RepID=UPI0013EC7611|nr:histidine kinase [Sphingobacterium sp. SGR-19]NGM67071.1 tetratricopeptide repeat protein [Sphingobacterium sp. SGR-19]
MHKQIFSSSFLKVGSILLLLYMHMQMCVGQQHSRTVLIDSADLLLKRGLTEESKSLYNEILTSAETEALPDTLRLRSHLGMARAWHMHQQLDSSLQSYLKALQLAKSTGQPSFLTDIYMGIGVLQAQVKNLTDAIRYLQQADSLSPQISIKKLQIRINLANTLMDADRDKEALEYLQESLQTARLLGQEAIQAIIHTNLSNLFIKAKNWEAAIRHSRESLQLRDQLQQPPSIVTYNNLGYALMQSGQLSEGKKAYLLVLPIAHGKQRQQLLKNLKDLSLLQNDYPAALQYFEDYDQLKDSIQQQEIEQRIAEITQAYESAEKSRQIQFLQHENATSRQQLTTVIVGSLLLILLICLATYLYLKNERVRRELSHSKTKNQLLRAQLNPHFIFNSLQHVQHYLYKNDKETSMAYLSNFARLMRATLAHSNTDWISLEEEIELLRNYLYLQRLASFKPFHYHVHVDPEIDLSFVQLPPMLLQPVVENAIKHGITDQPDPHVAIDVCLEDQKLKIRISDNGRGLSTGSIDRSNNLHKSMGMQLVNKRIREINKQYPNFVEVVTAKAHPTKTYTGTSVEFLFDLTKQSESRL